MENGTDELWHQFAYPFGPHPDGAVGLCAACRRLGHCRLGLLAEELDDSGGMRAPIRVPIDAEGGPGVAHGGWTAAALDEVLGHTLVLHGHFAVTGTLTVRFVKPVPIDRDVMGTARIVGHEGHRWSISGELTLATTGALLASAEGVWVERGTDHFDRARSWAAEQDAMTGPEPSA